MISRLELLRKAEQMAREMIDEHSALNDAEYTELVAKYPKDPEMAAEVLARRIITKCIDE